MLSAFEWQRHYLSEDNGFPIESSYKNFNFNSTGSDLFYFIRCNMHSRIIIIRVLNEISESGIGVSIDENISCIGATIKVDPTVPSM